MIIVMRSGATREDVDEVSKHLHELGFQTRPIFGVTKTIVGAVGAPDVDKFGAAEQLRAYDTVEEVHLVGKPYKLVAREAHPEGSIVRVGGIPIGGPGVVMMAGPCTIETEEQVFATAESVSRAGALILRGGAYKPSTSPYSFQGLGVPGLEMLRAAADRYGMKVVTEVMDPRKVDLVGQYADMLQIGTRNMQNYDLLKEVGQARIPVLLKRGMSAKLEEWLLAAEYIAAAGNEQIVLCERGIRSYDSFARNTLDLAVVPAAKAASHLPVVVDPSQGTGRRNLVTPMSLAAIAAGADGLIIEVHPNPDHAIKDGAQTLRTDQFETLVPQAKQVAQAIGREILAPDPVR